eukprot:TRINITY_DN95600_c0_g1_i1.p1 TRINITY_DN95600_c0_g1~~TRINITY_DN95600_c0_g1_i1.p1  ORF type:complete len:256 (+),score=110.46 TRINITY_DN95600_c0_g1_i1:53-769(+)
MAGDDPFEDRIQEYQELSEGIRSQLAELRALSPEDREESMALVEKDFQQARSLLTTMEFELRQLPPSTRKTYSPSMRLCHKDSQSLKRDIIRHRELDTRESLLAETNGSERVPEHVRKMREKLTKDQRGRLMHNQHLQNQTSEMLRSTDRSLVDSTQLGEGVMTELRLQRDILERSRAAVAASNVYVTNVRTTLQRMARRTMANKLATVIIIVIELFIIGVLVYYKFVRRWRRHHHDD